MFYGAGNLTMPASDTSLLPDKDGFHAWYLVNLPPFFKISKYCFVRDNYCESVMSGYKGYYQSEKMENKLG